MNRRQFLKIGSILVAAPAIVRIESLMPGRAVTNFLFMGTEFTITTGAIVDADTLQAMRKTILIAGQRAVDPPLVVPADLWGADQRDCNYLTPINYIKKGKFT